MGRGKKTSNKKRNGGSSNNNNATATVVVPTAIPCAKNTFESHEAANANNNDSPSSAALSCAVSPLTVVPVVAGGGTSSAAPQFNVPQFPSQAELPSTADDNNTTMPLTLATSPTPKQLEERRQAERNAEEEGVSPLPPIPSFPSAEFNVRQLSTITVSSSGGGDIDTSADGDPIHAAVGGKNNKGKGPNANNSNKRSSSPKSNSKRRKSGDEEGKEKEGRGGDACSAADTPLAIPFRSTSRASAASSNSQHTTTSSAVAVAAGVVVGAPSHFSIHNHNQSANNHSFSTHYGDGAGPGTETASVCVSDCTASASMPCSPTGHVYPFYGSHQHARTGSMPGAAAFHGSSQRRRSAAALIATPHSIISGYSTNSAANTTTVASACFPSVPAFQLQQPAPAPSTASANVSLVTATSDVSAGGAGAEQALVPNSKVEEGTAAGAEQALVSNSKAEASVQNATAAAKDEVTTNTEKGDEQTLQGAGNGNHLENPPAVGTTSPPFTSPNSLPLAVANQFAAATTASASPPMLSPRSASNFYSTTTANAPKVNNSVGTAGSKRGSTTSAAQQNTTASATNADLRRRSSGAFFNATDVFGVSAMTTMNNYNGGSFMTRSNINNMTTATMQNTQQLGTMTASATVVRERSGRQLGRDSVVSACGDETLNSYLVDQHQQLFLAAGGRRHNSIPSVATAAAAASSPSNATAISPGSFNHHHSNGRLFINASGGGGPRGSRDSLPTASLPTSPASAPILPLMPIEGSGGGGGQSPLHGRQQQQQHPYQHHHYHPQPQHQSQQHRWASYSASTPRLQSPVAHAAAALHSTSSQHDHRLSSPTTQRLQLQQQLNRQHQQQYLAATNSAHSLNNNNHTTNNSATVLAHSSATTNNTSSSLSPSPTRGQQQQQQQLPTDQNTTASKATAAVSDTTRGLKSPEAVTLEAFMSKLQRQDQSDTKNSFGGSGGGGYGGGGGGSSSSDFSDISDEEEKTKLKKLRAERRAAIRKSALAVRTEQPVDESPKREQHLPPTNALANTVLSSASASSSNPTAHNTVVVSGGGGNGSEGSGQSPAPSFPRVPSRDDAATNMINASHQNASGTAENLIEVIAIHTPIAASNGAATSSSNTDGQQRVSVPTTTTTAAAAAGNNDSKNSNSKSDSDNDGQLTSQAYHEYNIIDGEDDDGLFVPLEKRPTASPSMLQASLNARNASELFRAASSPKQPHLRPTNLAQLQQNGGGFYSSSASPKSVHGLGAGSPNSIGGGVLGSPPSHHGSVNILANVFTGNSNESDGNAGKSSEDGRKPLPEAEDPRRLLSSSTHPTNSSANSSILYDDENDGFHHHGAANISRQQKENNEGEGSIPMLRSDESDINNNDSNENENDASDMKEDDAASGDGHFHHPPPHRHRHRRRENNPSDRPVSARPSSSALLVSAALIGSVAAVVLSMAAAAYRNRQRNNGSGIQSSSSVGGGGSGSYFSSGLSYAVSLFKASVTRQTLLQGALVGVAANSVVRAIVEDALRTSDHSIASSRRQHRGNSASPTVDDATVTTTGSAATPSATTTNTITEATSRRPASAAASAIAHALRRPFSALSPTVRLSPMSSPDMTLTVNNNNDSLNASASRRGQGNNTTAAATHPHTPQPTHHIDFSSRLRRPGSVASHGSSSATAAAVVRVPSNSLATTATTTKESPSSPTATDPLFVVVSPASARSEQLFARHKTEVAEGKNSAAGTPHANRACSANNDDHAPVSQQHPIHHQRPPLAGEVKQQRLSSAGAATSESENKSQLVSPVGEVGKSSAGGFLSGLMRFVQTTSPSSPASPTDSNSLLRSSRAASPVVPGEESAKRTDETQQQQQHMSVPASPLFVGQPLLASSGRAAVSTASMNPSQQQTPPMTAATKIAQRRRAATGTGVALGGNNLFRGNRNRAESGRSNNSGNGGVFIGGGVYTNNGSFTSSTGMLGGMGGSNTNLRGGGAAANNNGENVVVFVTLPDGTIAKRRVGTGFSTVANMNNGSMAGAAGGAGSNAGSPHGSHNDNANPSSSVSPAVDKSNTAKYDVFADFDSTVVRGSGGGAATTQQHRRAASLGSQRIAGAAQQTNSTTTQSATTTPRNSSSNGNVGESGHHLSGSRHTTPLGGGAQQRRNSGSGATPTTQHHHHQQQQPSAATPHLTAPPQPHYLHSPSNVTSGSQSPSAFGITYQSIDGSPNPTYRNGAEFSSASTSPAPSHIPITAGGGSPSRTDAAAAATSPRPPPAPTAPTTNAPPPHHQRSASVPLHAIGGGSTSVPPSPRLIAQAIGGGVNNNSLFRNQYASNTSVNGGRPASTATGTMGGSTTSQHGGSNIDTAGPGYILPHNAFNESGRGVGGGGPFAHSRAGSIAGSNFNATAILHQHNSTISAADKLMSEIAINNTSSVNYREVLKRKRSLVTEKMRGMNKGGGVTGGGGGAGGSASPTASPNHPALFSTQATLQAAEEVLGGTLNHHNLINNNNLGPRGTSSQPPQRSIGMAGASSLTHMPPHRLPTQHQLPLHGAVSRSSDTTPSHTPRLRQDTHLHENALLHNTTLSATSTSFGRSCTTILTHHQGGGLGLAGTTTTSSNGNGSPRLGSTMGSMHHNNNNNVSHAVPLTHHNLQQQQHPHVQQQQHHKSSANASPLNLPLGAASMSMHGGGGIPHTQHHLPAMANFSRSTTTAAPLHPHPHPHPHPHAAAANQRANTSIIVGGNNNSASPSGSAAPPLGRGAGVGAVITANSSGAASPDFGFTANSSGGGHQHHQHHQHHHASAPLFGNASFGSAIMAQSSSGSPRFGSTASGERFMIGGGARGGGGSADALAQTHHSSGLMMSGSPRMTPHRPPSSFTNNNSIATVRSASGSMHQTSSPLLLRARARGASSTKLVANGSKLMLLSNIAASTQHSVSSVTGGGRGSNAQTSPLLGPSGHGGHSGGSAADNSHSRSGSPHDNTNTNTNANSQKGSPLKKHGSVLATMFPAVSVSLQANNTGSPKLTAAPAGKAPNPPPSPSATNNANATNITNDSTVNDAIANDTTNSSTYGAGLYRPTGFCAGSDASLDAAAGAEEEDAATSTNTHNNKSPQQNANAPLTTGGVVDGKAGQGSASPSGGNNVKFSTQGPQTSSPLIADIRAFGNDDDDDENENESNGNQSTNSDDTSSTSSSTSSESENALLQMVDSVVPSRLSATIAGAASITAMPRTRRLSIPAISQLATGSSDTSGSPNQKLSRNVTTANIASPMFIDTADPASPFHNGRANNNMMVPTSARGDGNVNNSDVASAPQHNAGRRGSGAAATSGAEHFRANWQEEQRSLLRRGSQMIPPPSSSTRHVNIGAHHNTSSSSSMHLMMPPGSPLHPMGSGDFTVQPFSARGGGGAIAPSSANTTPRAGHTMAAPRRASISVFGMGSHSASASAAVTPRSLHLTQIGSNNTPRGAGGSFCPITDQHRRSSASAAMSSGGIGGRRHTITEGEAALLAAATAARRRSSLGAGSSSALTPTAAAMAAANAANAAASVGAGGQTHLPLAPRSSIATTAGGSVQQLASGMFDSLSAGGGGGGTDSAALLHHNSSFSGGLAAQSVTSGGFNVGQLRGKVTINATRPNVGGSAKKNKSGRRGVTMESDQNLDPNEATAQLGVGRGRKGSTAMNLTIKGNAKDVIAALQTAILHPELVEESVEQTTANLNGEVPLFSRTTAAGTGIGGGGSGSGVIPAAAASFALGSTIGGVAGLGVGDFIPAPSAMMMNNGNLADAGISNASTIFGPQMASACSPLVSVASPRDASLSTNFAAGSPHTQHSHSAHQLHSLHRLGATGSSGKTFGSGTLADTNRERAAMHSTTYNGRPGSPAGAKQQNESHSHHHHLHHHTSSGYLRSQNSAMMSSSSPHSSPRLHAHALKLRGSNNAMTSSSMSPAGSPRSAKSASPRGMEHNNSQSRNGRRNMSPSSAAGSPRERLRMGQQQHSGNTLYPPHPITVGGGHHHNGASSSGSASPKLSGGGGAGSPLTNNSSNAPSPANADEGTQHHVVGQHHLLPTSPQHAAMRPHLSSVGDDAGAMPSSAPRSSGPSSPNGRNDNDMFPSTANASFNQPPIGLGWGAAAIAVSKMSTAYERAAAEASGALPPMAAARGGNGANAPQTTSTSVAVAALGDDPSAELAMNFNNQGAAASAANHQASSMISQYTTTSNVNVNGGGVGTASSGLVGVKSFIGNRMRGYSTAAMTPLNLPSGGLRSRGMSGASAVTTTNGSLASVPFGFSPKGLGNRVGSNTDLASSGNALHSAVAAAEGHLESSLNPPPPAPSSSAQPVLSSIRPPPLPPHRSLLMSGGGGQGMSSSTHTTVDSRGSNNGNGKDAGGGGGGRDTLVFNADADLQHQPAPLSHRNSSLAGLLNNNNRTRSSLNATATVVSSFNNTQLNMATTATSTSGGGSHNLFAASLRSIPMQHTMTINNSTMLKAMQEAQQAAGGSANTTAAATGDVVGSGQGEGEASVQHHKFANRVESAEDNHNLLLASSDRTINRELSGLNDELGGDDDHSSGGGGGGDHPFGPNAKRMAGARFAEQDIQDGVVLTLHIRPPPIPLYLPDDESTVTEEEAELVRMFEKLSEEKLQERYRIGSEAQPRQQSTGSFGGGGALSSAADPHGSGVNPGSFVGSSNDYSPKQQYSEEFLLEARKRLAMLRGRRKLRKQQCLPTNAYFAQTFETTDATLEQCERIAMSLQMASQIVRHYGGRVYATESNKLVAVFSILNQTLDDAELSEAAINGISESNRAIGAALSIRQELDFNASVWYANIYSEETGEFAGRQIISSEETFNFPEEDVGEHIFYTYGIGIDQSPLISTCVYEPIVSGTDEEVQNIYDAMDEVERGGDDLSALTFKEFNSLSGTALETSYDLAQLNYHLSTRILMSEAVQDEVQSKVISLVVDVICAARTRVGKPKDPNSDADSSDCTDVEEEENEFYAHQLQLHNASESLKNESFTAESFSTRSASMTSPPLSGPNSNSKRRVSAKAGTNLSNLQRQRKRGGKGGSVGGANTSASKQHYPTVPKKVPAIQRIAKMGVFELRGERDELEAKREEQQQIILYEKEQRRQRHAYLREVELCEPESDTTDEEVENDDGVIGFYLPERILIPYLEALYLFRSGEFKAASRCLSERVPSRYIQGDVQIRRLGRLMTFYSAHPQLARAKQVSHYFRIRYDDPWENVDEWYEGWRIRQHERNEERELKKILKSCLSDDVARRRQRRRQRALLGGVGGMFAQHLSVHHNGAAAAPAGGNGRRMSISMGSVSGTSSTHEMNRAMNNHTNANNTTLVSNVTVTTNANTSQSAAANPLASPNPEPTATATNLNSPANASPINANISTSEAMSASGPSSPTTVAVEKLTSAIENNNNNGVKDEATTEVEGKQQKEGEKDECVVGGTAAEHDDRDAPPNLSTTERRNSRMTTISEQTSSTTEHTPSTNPEGLLTRGHSNTASKLLNPTHTALTPASAFAAEEQGASANAQPAKGPDAHGSGGTQPTPFTLPLSANATPPPPPPVHDDGRDAVAVDGDDALTVPISTNSVTHHPQPHGHHQPDLFSVSVNSSIGLGATNNGGGHAPPTNATLPSLAAVASHSHEHSTSTPITMSKMDDHTLMTQSGSVHDMPLAVSVAVKPTAANYDNSNNPAAENNHLAGSHNSNSHNAHALHSSIRDSTFFDLAGRPTAPPLNRRPGSGASYGGGGGLGSRYNSTNDLFLRAATSEVSAAATSHSHGTGPSLPAASVSKEPTTSSGNVSEEPQHRVAVSVEVAAAQQQAPIVPHLQASQLQRRVDKKDEEHHAISTSDSPSAGGANAALHNASALIDVSSSSHCTTGDSRSVLGGFIQSNSINNAASGCLQAPTPLNLSREHSVLLTADALGVADAFNAMLQRRVNATTTTTTTTATNVGSGSGTPTAANTTTSGGNGAATDSDEASKKYLNTINTIADATPHKEDHADNGESSGGAASPEAQSPAARVVIAPMTGTTLFNQTTLQATYGGEEDKAATSNIVVVSKPIPLPPMHARQATNLNMNDDETRDAKKNTPDAEQQLIVEDFNTLEQTVLNATILERRAEPSVDPIAPSQSDSVVRHDNGDHNDDNATKDDGRSPSADQHGFSSYEYSPSPPMAGHMGRATAGPREMQQCVVDEDNKTTKTSPASPMVAAVSKGVDVVAGGGSNTSGTSFATSSPQDLLASVGLMAPHHLEQAAREAAESEEQRHGTTQKQQTDTTSPTTSAATTPASHQQQQQAAAADTNRYSSFSHEGSPAPLPPSQRIKGFRHTITATNQQLLSPNTEHNDNASLATADLFAATPQTPRTRNAHGIASTPPLGAAGGMSFSMSKARLESASSGPGSQYLLEEEWNRAAPTSTSLSVMRGAMSAASRAQSTQQPAAMANGGGTPSMVPSLSMGALDAAISNAGGGQSVTRPSESRARGGAATGAAGRRAHAMQMQHMGAGGGGLSDIKFLEEALRASSMQPPTAPTANAATAAMTPSSATPAESGGTGAGMGSFALSGATPLRFGPTSSPSQGPTAHQQVNGSFVLGGPDVRGADGRTTPLNLDGSNPTASGLLAPSPSFAPNKADATETGDGASQFAPTPMSPATNNANSAASPQTPASGNANSMTPTTLAGTSGVQVGGGIYVNPPSVWQDEGSMTFKDVNRVDWCRSEKVLGEGAFGQVYLGMRPSDGKLVAIKTLRIPKIPQKDPNESEDPNEAMKGMTQAERNLARRRAAAAKLKGGAVAPPKRDFAAEQSKVLASLIAEVRVYSETQHTNIVQFAGCGIVGNRLLVNMEFVSGGSLQTIISSFGALPVPAVQRYLKHVLRGLDYLHNHPRGPIVHCDVKPGNVLLSVDGTCKVTDFGTAVNMTKLDSANTATAVGTPLYMSPEHAAAKPTTKSDVYSVGLMAYELLTGKLPFTLPDAIAIHRHLHRLRSDETYGPEIKQSDLPSEAAYRFVTRCLYRDPNKRPSCDQLLHSDFLFGHQDISPQAASLARSMTTGMNISQSMKQRGASLFSPGAGGPMRRERTASNFEDAAGAGNNTNGHKDSTATASGHHLAVSQRSINRGISPSPAAQPITSPSSSSVAPAAATSNAAAATATGEEKTPSTPGLMSINSDNANSGANGGGGGGGNSNTNLQRGSASGVNISKLFTVMPSDGGPVSPSSPRGGAPLRRVPSSLNQQQQQQQHGYGYGHSSSMLHVKQTPVPIFGGSASAVGSPVLLSRGDTVSEDSRARGSAAAAMAAGQRATAAGDSGRVGILSTQFGTSADDEQRQRLENYKIPFGRSVSTAGSGVGGVGQLTGGSYAAGSPLMAAAGADDEDDRVAERADKLWAVSGESDSRRQSDVLFGVSGSSVEDKLATSPAARGKNSTTTAAAAAIAVGTGSRAMLSTGGASADVVVREHSLDNPLVYTTPSRQLLQQEDDEQPTTAAVVPASLMAAADEHQATIDATAAAAALLSAASPPPPPHGASGGGLATAAPTPISAFPPARTNATIAMTMSQSTESCASFSVALQPPESASSNNNSNRGGTLRRLFADGAPASNGVDDPQADSVTASFGMTTQSAAAEKGEASNGIGMNGGRFVSIDGGNTTDKKSRERTANANDLVSPNASVTTQGAAAIANDMLRDNKLKQKQQEQFESSSTAFPDDNAMMYPHHMRRAETARPDGMLSFARQNNTSANASDNVADYASPLSPSGATTATATGSPTSPKIRRIVVLSGGPIKPSTLLPQPTPTPPPPAAAATVESGATPNVESSKPSTAKGGQGNGEEQGGGGGGGLAALSEPHSVPLISVSVVSTPERNNSLAASTNCAGNSREVSNPCEVSALSTTHFHSTSGPALSSGGSGGGNGGVGNGGHTLHPPASSGFTTLHLLSIRGGGAYGGGAVTKTLSNASGLSALISPRTEDGAPPVALSGVVEGAHSRRISMLAGASSADEDSIITIDVTAAANAEKGTQNAETALTSTHEHSTAAAVAALLLDGGGDASHFSPDATDVVTTENSLAEFPPEGK